MPYPNYFLSYYPNLTDPVININNKTLQVVDKFKYLGSVLQNNATADRNSIKNSKSSVKFP